MPNAILSAQNISRHDSQGKVLLNPCDLAIYPADQLAIIGPSGSGKSVLLRLLALLDEPSSGQLRFHNQAINLKDINYYRSQIIYASQTPVLLEGNVLDNLKFPFQLAIHKNKSLNHDVLKQYLHCIERDESFLDLESHNLSGGEKQMVCLIRFLLLNPQVLLLDEATAALDPESTLYCESLITTWLAEKPEERAFVFISHHPEQQKRLSNKICHIKKGILNLD